ncbi:MAG: PEGA domain-containing protein [Deltaproteobacteria bacterium]|nr:PEGA domain-containing protein [Deltaproteobacteria bacterium]
MKRLVAVAAILLVPSLAMAKKAPSLPVMQFEVTNGADPKSAALATDAASESLRDLNVFKVISSDDIKKILSFQRDKATLGGKCNEDQCLAEIGGALGADFMVSGKVTKLGSTLKLELQLFNNAKAKVDNAVSQDDIKDDKGLVDAAKNLARRAVAPILEKNSGQLFVNVTAQGADGATIDIDDKTAGVTTPPGVQPPPIPLGWGPHHVRVKKEGFLTFEKDIQIDEGQSTTLVVTLVPSPDFIDAYKSRNSKLRIGAYATGVIAIAAAGFAVEQNYENSKLYRAYDAYRLYQDGNANQSALAAATDTNHHYSSAADACSAMERLTGLPQSGSSTDCANANQKAYQNGSSQLTRIYLVSGLGVVAAGTAVTLYILSDDPHRYDSFLQANPSGDAAPASGTAPAAASPEKTGAKLVPQFGFVPLQGGFFSSVGVSF